MKKWFKGRFLWRLHSVLGLATGIPLLVIAVTGSVLVFKPELEQLLQPDLFVSEPTPEGRLPFDVLYEKVNAALPDYVFLGWEFYDEPTRSDKITVVPYGSSGGLDLYLNPYNGEVKGVPTEEAGRPLGWLRKLHYTFLGDHAGIFVVGILGILMALLALTGFLVYRKFWTSLFTMRWRTSLRVLSGNLHKRVGVLSSPIFLILAISGAYWNIPHGWRVLTSNHEPPSFVGWELGEGVSLDALVAQSGTELEGFRPTFIRLPNNEGRPLVFFGEIEGQSSLRDRYGSMMLYHPRTGELLRAAPIADAPFLDQMDNAFFTLHFGTFGGWFTRVLYAIVGLSPGVLAVSGGIVWWQRLRQLKQRERVKAEQSLVGAAPSTMQN
jgi:uncharacterized iron-regulated membrane protein